MKNLSIIFFISLSIFLFWNSFLEEDLNSISGAYEALNLQGTARTYPLGEIPEKAHFAAWESIKNKQAFEKSNASVEPWESLGPHNRGGRMLAIEFNPQNPTTIYGGSASGGLWRSYTGGVGVDAWERVPIDFPVLGVSAIAFAPNDSMTMYIGTGEVYNISGVGTGAAYRSTRGTYGIGILKSQDGGVTWAKSLDWSYLQNHGVWAVKVVPTNPNIVFAATTDGTYRSTDAGATWEKVMETKMAMDLLINTIDTNQILVSCGNFGSAGRGIYKTTNGGDSWIQVGNNLPTNFQGKIMLGAAPSAPNTLYASIGNGFSGATGATWLYKSTDFGTTWTLQNDTDYSRWQGWFAHDVAVHPDDPNKITTIGIEVWASSDGGIELNKITEGGVGFPDPPIGGPDGEPNFIHSDAHDIRYHPTNGNVFYVASDGGISRTTDGGQTFEGCNGRLQTTQFYNGFSTSHQDADFCMGGLQDNNTIVYDGDKSWRLIWGGDGSWTAINPYNDDVIYASSQYLNMGRSTDGGEEFQWVTPPNDGNPAFIAPFVIAQNNASILYAGSNFIYKTQSQGNIWVAMNNGQALDGENPAFSMEVAPSNDNVLYVGTAPFDSRGKVFVTTDGGGSFSNVTQNLPDRFPSDITVDPFNEAVAYVTFSGFGTGHIFQTLDYGESWIDISGDLPDVPTNAVIVDPWNTDHIYVGNDIGVFVSEDRGATWTTFQDGLPPAVLAFDLKISPINRKLRIATHGNGAFERDLIATEEVVATTSLPSIIETAAIFPNPIQDEFTLLYQLKEDTKISISIVDTNGRLLKNILSNQFFFEGEHQENITISTFVAGTYFCVIETKKGKQTIPLIKL